MTEQERLHQRTQIAQYASALFAARIGHSAVAYMSNKRLMDVMDQCIDSAIDMALAAQDKFETHVIQNPEKYGEPEHSIELLVAALARRTES